MRHQFRNLLGLLLLLAGGSLYAQQTGVIHGFVTDEGGEGLPGVVVTVESPNLQRARSAVTGATGEFLLRLLPPGNYTVTVAMTGMQTVKQSVNLGLGQTSRPTIVMRPQVSSEEMVVVATVDPVLDTSDVAANFDAEFIDKIATNRDLNSRALLSPGTSQSGANGSVAISGAQTFENLFLVDGAIANFDNVRSGASNIVAPDSIQETTVLTGSVSAEFGQFTGGIINSITKSGGNEFSGSYRASFQSDDWTARDPLELETNVTQNDEIDRTDSLTFGGPIIKDRLWFFISATKFESDSPRTLASGLAITDQEAADLTAAGYAVSPGQIAGGARDVPSSREVDRLAFKLTASPFEGHEIILDYKEREDVTTGRVSDSADVGILTANTSDIPEESLSLNYRGIITPSFSVDLQYTDRSSTFTGSSFGADTDIRYVGTAYQDNNSRWFGAPVPASPDDETREASTWHAKANYFLVTDNAGSHDLSFGISDYKVSRMGNNNQAPSNWNMWNVYTQYDGIDDLEPTPIFSGGQGTTASADLIFWPIQKPSAGSDYSTQSAYINDRWTFNENWSFNVGARYDKNDASNEDQQQASKSDQLSPRMAVEYDLRGDGSHKFSVSYARYVARLNDAAQDASTAGSPRVIVWSYYGAPTSNVADVFAWLENEYGAPAGATLNPIERDASGNLLYPALADAAWFDTTINPADEIPNIITDPNLESPFSDEYRLGYSTRFTKGHFKADYIHRKYKAFYASHINTTGHNDGQFGRYTGGPTGVSSTDDPAFAGQDMEFFTNDDENYRREYNAVQLQAAYYLSDNFTLSGNWTWSQNRGNFTGETEGQAAVSGSALTFRPEYSDFANRFPDGYLDGDQRHIGRIFASYDLSTPVGDFNFSATQRYESGAAYSAFMDLDIREGGQDVTAYWGLPSRTEFGYRNPPTSTRYYVGGRGSYRGDDMTQTDLGLNWSFNFGRLEVFTEFNIFNLFNQDAAPYSFGYYDATVNSLASLNADGSPNSGYFNVYNETPVEGTHYELGEDFGQPNSSDAFQGTRQVTIDVGIRF